MVLLQAAASLHPENVRIALAANVVANVCALVNADGLVFAQHGAPPMYAVNLIELNADDKIAHERIYILDGREAPDWRAPWRSDQPADSVTWEPEA